MEKCAMLGNWCRRGRSEDMEACYEARYRALICINDQWRICFRWNDGDATDVEIADYH
jgi:plasmid maintenance system killer protein